MRVAAAWLAEVGSAAIGGGLRADLRKCIPVGAGLGGGSSDAARAILGLSRMTARASGSPGRRTNSRRSPPGSAATCRSSCSAPAACAGRGEVVRPVPPPRPRWAVLVLPPVHMPTADVYRRFDGLGLGRERDVTDGPDWRAWAALGADELLPRLVNNLEPAASRCGPTWTSCGGRPSGRPTGSCSRGSGSSLFTLFDGRGEAEAAARAVAGQLGVDGNRGGRRSTTTWRSGITCRAGLDIGEGGLGKCSRWLRGRPVPGADGRGGPGKPPRCAGPGLLGPRPARPPPAPPGPSCDRGGMLQSNRPRRPAPVCRRTAQVVSERRRCVVRLTEVRINLSPPASDHAGPSTAPGRNGHRSPACRRGGPRHAGTGGRLRAFCSLTFDDAFVVRDI